MTNTTDNLATVVDVTRRSTEPQLVEPGKIYAVTDADGNVHELNLDRDEYRDHPRRKTGTVRIGDVDTFTRYLAKHGTTDTEIWADVERASIIAVINAHATDTAGFGDHRATFTARYTPAWQAWAALNRKWLDQTAFAEHIEDRSIDIVKPEGAVMLEIAQSISGTTGATFESSQRLSTGQARIEYKETVEAKAGHRGQLDIPTTIELGLAPFYGASPYKVVARFRYRLGGGNLKLCYALERPENVVRAAFDNVLDDLAAQTERDILTGWPELR